MRKYYLDNIRWITVLLVVLYHVFFMFNSITTEIVIGPFYEKQCWDAVMYILYPWFMILLFIVAGMSSRYYLEKHTVKEFVRSRSRKLLLPTTLGLLLTGWVQGYISMSITGAFNTMPDTIPAPILFLIMTLSGTGVLWFAQMLWLFSMILALVRKVEKGKLYAASGKANVLIIILMVIPVWLSGLILNTPVITVYRFGVYGFTFFLGYFLFAHDEVIERISRFRVPFIIGAIVLGVLYVYLHFGDNYADMPVVGSVPAVAFAWSAILAILGGMKAWGDKTWAFAGFMTKRSFGIYVFHYLTLSATAYALHKYTSLGALPTYLITGCAAFFGSLLLYEIVSRIPFIRWCILGIKKEKNNVQRQSDTASKA